MCGITQLDRICNQDIRQRFGVVAIADKLREESGQREDRNNDACHRPCVPRRLLTYNRSIIHLLFLR
ncbi:hypothetical protein Y032_0101g3343 [Ancylostoma ceylanicum]|nr:hypothetical protein Y032_0101g3343 [Ancylostoma ceylanicum]